MNKDGSKFIVLDAVDHFLFFHDFCKIICDAVQIFLML
jgi:hypothetical protein